jgi:hypothetical protein
VKKIIIYTVHKAGSMFIHRLTKNITEELGINYISINDVEYEDAIPTRSWNAFIEDVSLSGCFGPIRGGEAVPSIPDNLDMYSIAVHMRDPRDVLTSLYYSMTYSHGSRSGGFQFTNWKRIRWLAEGIDRFVIRMTPEYIYRYGYLCSSLIGNKNVKLIKYEDMITTFDIWLFDFLRVFPLSEIKQNNMHEKLLNEYKDEFSVSEEDIYAHKRQIAAGDHKRKLKPGTIDRLNNDFKDILSLLNYPF